MTAFITGTGAAVPERVVTNEEIAGALGLNPAQILKSSGIQSRRWADEGATTSSLASAALTQAITDAGIQSEDVDYLILGTMTPDRFIPGSSPAIQKKTGLREVPCLDIRAACCNALYGLQVSRALIESGAARRVAICLAEIQSVWLDLSPKSATISMLFGDGASALIVSRDPGPQALEVIDIVLATDGSFVDDLGMRRPGTEFGPVPAELSADDSVDYRPRMVGQSVILHATRKMTAACQTVLERNAMSNRAVTWIVPHQANVNLLMQVARNLEFSWQENRIVNILGEFGNTSSASMGMALDHLRRAARIKGDDLLLLPAFGAGFTWGAGLCRAHV